MKTFFIFLIVLLSCFALAVVFFCIKSHKFFITLLFNAFVGVCVLAIIDLTAKLTGMFIPINPYTVTGSAVFGLPALALFLILQVIV